MGFDVSTIDKAAGRAIEAFQIVTSADLERARIKSQGNVAIAQIRAGYRPSVLAGLGSYLPLVAIAIGGLVLVKLLGKR